MLDVGCGTGEQAVNVSGIIGSSGRLTGIDPSSHRIALAQKKFGDDSTRSVHFLGDRQRTSVPSRTLR